MILNFDEEPADILARQTRSLGLVSHNLRGTLATTISMLRLYQLGEVENVDAHLQGIENNLIHILQQFDTLSAQASEQMATQTGPSSLSVSLQRVIQALSHEIQCKQAEFCYELDVDLIPCPGSYLDSALYNVISNAVKYAHPERLPLIHIHSYATEKEVILRVSDNGLGLNSQQRAQIFEAYKTFHPHPQAQGLGLYLTRQHLSELGANIELISNEQEVGCCFQIRFLL